MFLLIVNVAYKKHTEVLDDTLKYNAQVNGQQ